MSESNKCECKIVATGFAIDNLAIKQCRLCAEAPALRAERDALLELNQLMLEALKYTIDHFDNEDCISGTLGLSPIRAAIAAAQAQKTD